LEGPSKKNRNQSKVFLDSRQRLGILRVSAAIKPRSTTKKMTRTKNEIQADLDQARKKYDNWNNVQNEGATDGYNPHLDGIQKLADELAEVEKAEKADKLSGDSLKAEQAWFNAQGFTSPALAQKACLKRGYTMSDLFAAVKAAKQG
jgi:hypothetical protein